MNNKAKKKNRKGKGGRRKGGYFISIRDSHSNKIIFEQNPQ